MPKGDPLGADGTAGLDAFAPFERHVRACNTLVSVEGLVAFRIEDRQVGWLGAELVRALTLWPRRFQFDGRGVALDAGLRTPGARSEALAETSAWLARQGLVRIRDEEFDIRPGFGEPSLARIDRGCLTAFGIRSEGVHLNGLVRGPDGLRIWVARRSATKSVAPGQLDQLVAGGIPAGLGPEETLVKEAAEEAGMAAGLALQARARPPISYAMRVKGGVRIDKLHVFDLDLPETFQPVPVDGEVEAFELLPAQRLVEAVRDTDSVKFNVNLVLIGLFLREGLIPGDEAARIRLSDSLRQAD